MRKVAFVLSVVFVLASVHPVSAALDTKAAGKCVALGAALPAYAPKAKAILETAQRTGHFALVYQRAEEEVQAFIAAKGDKRAVEAWAFSASRACNSF